MAYVITDGCVSCGTCAGECPPLRQFLKVTASTLSTLIPASSAEPALLPVQPALSKANYKLHKKTTEHLLCGFFSII